MFLNSVFIESTLYNSFPSGIFLFSKSTISLSGAPLSFINLVNSWLKLEPSVFPANSVKWFLPNFDILTLLIGLAPIFPEPPLSKTGTSVVVGFPSGVIVSMLTL